MLRRAAKRTKEDKLPSSGTKRKTEISDDEIVPLGETSEKDETEVVLEKLVLGGDEDILDHLALAGVKKSKKKRLEDEKPKPVWVDEEDEEQEVVVDQSKAKKVPAKRYKQHLKTKFEELAGTPSWAKLRWEKSESEDSEDEGSKLLQSTGNYLADSEWLPKGLIQLKKCGDANQQAPAKGKLHATEFHPSAQVMLAAGTDHTLRLFQIDGKTNPLIQSMYLEGFPIFGASFTSEGTEVILSSIHKSFYYYDMIAGKMINVPKIKGLEESHLKRFVMSPDGKYITFLGKYGRMHLISAKSKEWISSLKMNGSVEAVTYTPDGSKMLSHGDDGEVYVWDMRTRDCVHRFYDEGTIKGTALAVSKNSQYIATGSYSGVVNIYDESCLTSSTPKPQKAILNLTSPCTALKFNSTAEILAMASHYTERAVKLVHFPSMTVFSNYPERTDPLRIPLSMDFSLNSGYFTIGTQKGSAMLYRVKHYSDY